MCSLTPIEIIFFSALTSIIVSAFPLQYSTKRRVHHVDEEANTYDIAYPTQYLLFPLSEFYTVEGG